MRLSAAVLAILVASAVSAQLTPGVVVQSGAPFPLVADINGDGLDDLVQERGYILNEGGVFGEQRSYVNIPEDRKPIGVLDVNGDGLADLLTEDRGYMVPVQIDPTFVPGAPTFRLYIANGPRSYPKFPIDITSGARPYIADVDADGKDDLLLSRGILVNGIAIETEMIVLRSRGDGTFDRLAPFRVPADPQVYPDTRLQSADVNHDGLPDLVFRCTRDLAVLLGAGDGTFTVKSFYLPMNGEFGGQSMRLGDIDSDTHPDVVLQAFRGVRVLFGDGKGNFPRMTRARIAKEHDIQLWPGIPDIGVDRLNQPKDITIGHFTRSDRLQIAAGTVEGDLVVLSYEHGSLKEVARTFTEFWLLTVRAGNFRTPGVSDVYAMGTYIWGDMYPRPRIFYGTTSGATANASAASVLGGGARGRAVRSAPLGRDLEMQMSGECMDAVAQRWNLVRDAVFGSGKAGDATIEVLFDRPTLYFRLSAPYAKETVYGVLEDSEGTFSGTAQVTTNCGAKTMSITAKLQ